VITDLTLTRPIDGAALLDTIRQTLTRIVPALSDHQADAVTLWIAASHALPAWDHAPLLVVTGPPAVGKTTLLDVVSDLAHYPLHTDGSARALMRALARRPATLIADDVDPWLRPRMKTVPVLCWTSRRANRDDDQLCMAALATQNPVPAVLAGRAVVLTLRASTTPPAPAVVPRVLATALHRWLATGWDIFLVLYLVDCPLTGETALYWRPLLEVADHAGQDWPDRARRAALALSTNDTDAAA
jgi:Protein of unknown function (DUF3631)